MSELCLAFSAVFKYKIKNIKYEGQKTKNTITKYKNKIQNAKNAKRKPNKIIIESIKITKSIVLYLK